MFQVYLSSVREIGPRDINGASSFAVGERESLVYEGGANDAAGYIICNIDDPGLCWSNGEGWVTETYDTFTPEERETLSLPIGGEWESVPWNAA